MPLLSSGLPDVVADGEEITRFIPQSNRYSNGIPLPSAFLPNPKTRNASVFRIAAEPKRILGIWQEVAPNAPPLRAAATFKAGAAKSGRLAVIPEEPPPAHANIEGWIWIDQDPVEQKSAQKKQALELCKASTLTVF